MSRLAALDLGSNSFHLLVADTRPRDRIKRVHTRKLTIRLGEPVARSGKLGDDGFQRAVDAFGELVRTADDQGADRIVAVATEALRVAEDGQAFRDQMLADHGVPIQLLTGLDEASLSLRGMASALNLGDDEQVLGLDLGGGSLEIALGGTAGLVAGASLPLGGAKLLDRISDPPRLHEQAALHDHAMSLLRPAAEEILAHRTDGDRLTVIGTAGTIRDLGRLGLTMTGGSPPARVRGMMVSREQLELAYARLCSVDVHERMDLPGVSSKRADLLPGAGVAVLAVMEAFGLSAITLCDWGLREGVLLDVVARDGIVDEEKVVSR
jgi:exopolyphosphatase / guanosine-5'-triphosphate,3'-diphosphate pyrophosphatase